MLKIEKLDSGYGKLKVLQGIDIEVKAGEIVALIGPNGAGKSTVLKSVFNLCDIYSGKINFEGEKITKLPTHELIKKGISYVPQGKINFSNLTVKENLELGGRLTNHKLSENMKKVFDKFPELKRKQKKHAFSLSGGQQQMLALGRALMQEPKLLLLDEPSLGLSPKLVTEVFKMIKNLRKEGLAILIVEQNAKKAVEIADKTYLLEDGKVALKGGKEILKHKKIKNVYLGGRY